jgi:hypothetical protein
VSGKLQKVAYKPVGLLLGLGAGAIAGIVFKEIWKLASGDDDAPTPTDEALSAAEGLFVRCPSRLDSSKGKLSGWFFGYSVASFCVSGSGGEPLRKLGLFGS